MPRPQSSRHAFAQVKGECGKEQEERKRTVTCVAPGVHSVELFNDEQSFSSGGNSPICL